MFLHHLEDFWVPKELRDPDQKILSEQLSFLWLVGERLQIAVEGALAQQRHPPRDAPDKRAGLVAGEGVARLVLKPVQHFVQPLLDRAQHVLPAACLLDMLAMAHDFQNPPGHVLRSEDKVDKAGGRGTVGHPGEPRAAAFLNKRYAALRLDRTDAKRSVRPRAGEHYGKRLPAGFLCDGFEEPVDRGADAFLSFVLKQFEHAVPDFEEGTGGYDVDMIGPDRRPVLDAFDGHRCMRAKQLVHERWLIGGEMLDHDIRETAVIRDGLNK